MVDLLFKLCPHNWHSYHIFAINKDQLQHSIEEDGVKWMQCGKFILDLMVYCV